jgi:hypothetical protein
VNTLCCSVVTETLEEFYTFFVFFTVHRSATPPALVHCWTIGAGCESTDRQPTCVTCSCKLLPFIQPGLHDTAEGSIRAPVAFVQAIKP